MPFSRPVFTGFPFDDSDFERETDRDNSFRSHLDDIAKRHPQFAEHLKFDRFPFRSNTWERKRRGSQEQEGRSHPGSSQEPPADQRRFGRPFETRFDQFAFPFGKQFDHEPQYCYEGESTPQSCQPKQTEVKQEDQEEALFDKPPEVPKERGRKPHPKVPQSNTVDLGQKQPPVDDNRGQRSMSAPPENRAGPRYVSSINIPINFDSGEGDMGTWSSHSPQPQPPQQHKSNERVIPIHVEGRDEPVIPKNVHQTFQQQSPQPEKIFGQKPSQFTQYVNRPEPQPPKAEHRPEESPKPQQKQEETSPQPEQCFAPQKGSSSKADPISQIQGIQKDVLELMNSVEKFDGKPKDKHYLYLDEMLTRNLLKLDDVETEGKENIRQARKGAIKCIEKCISILESKAAANQAQAEQMDTENKSEPPTEIQDSSSKLIAAETQHAEATNEHPLEEAQPEQKEQNVKVEENKIEEVLVEPIPAPSDSQSNEESKLEAMEVTESSQSASPSVEKTVVDSEKKEKMKGKKKNKPSEKTEKK